MSKLILSPYAVCSMSGVAPIPGLAASNALAGESRDAKQKYAAAALRQVIFSP
jgi:hypothetical protein